MTTTSFKSLASSFSTKLICERLPTFSSWFAIPTYEITRVAFLSASMV
ncbi:Uncharacterised protein [Segatella copri]|nr:Uncharacterised protein [Segatella copri]